MTSPIARTVLMVGGPAAGKSYQATDDQIRGGVMSWADTSAAVRMWDDTPDAHETATIPVETYYLRRLALLGRVFTVAVWRELPHILRDQALMEAMLKPDALQAWNEAGPRG